MDYYEKEFRSLREANGLLKKEACTSEESVVYYQMLNDNQKLPDDIFYTQDNYGTLFFRVSELKEENKVFEFLLQKQTLHLQSIAKYMRFFSILAIILLGLSVALGLFVGLYLYW